MRRREFLGLFGGAVAMPLAARAQQGDRIRRIGYLRVAPPSERELQALLQGIGAHDYVQGRDFVLVPQWGDGNMARISELAVTLVNVGADVIVTESTVVTRALAAVTATIPIVMASSADPFVGGLVKNLSQPGGNVTGFTSQSVETTGKVFEILMQMGTKSPRIAVLSPSSIWSMFAQTEDPAAQMLGIEIRRIDLPTADAQAVGSAMAQAVAAGIRHVMVRGTPFYSPAQRKVLIDSAAAHKLIVMWERRDYVEQGGLVSYSADVRDQHRRAGDYVARILKGANPGALPIQQPTKFEFIVNLKTAKALGLEVPATLLARADDVIE